MVRRVSTAGFNGLTLSTLVRLPGTMLALLLVTQVVGGCMAATSDPDTRGSSDAELAARSTLVKWGERGAVSSLYIAAAPEQIFDAMTQCEHVQRWMGAAGREIVACTSDVRTGGTYRFEFGAPSGRRFVMFGDYAEVARPHRFVHTEAYEGYSWEPLHVTTEITRSASGSVVRVSVEYPSAAIRDEDFSNLEHSMGAYDRLREYLSRAAE